MKNKNAKRPLTLPSTILSLSRDESTGDLRSSPVGGDGETTSGQPFCPTTGRRVERVLSIAIFTRYDWIRGEALFQRASSATESSGEEGISFLDSIPNRAPWMVFVESGSWNSRNRIRSSKDCSFSCAWKKRNVENYHQFSSSEFGSLLKKIIDVQKYEKKNKRIRKREREEERENL